jgi:type I restriction enzyme S subunit
MGDPPGDSSVYPVGRPPAVITADCIRWRIHPGLGSAWFFAYAARTRSVRGQILSETQGVAQKKISLARFSRVLFPLAPRGEQQRIVAEIEKQFTRLDAAVATLKAVQAKLKRARASVLKAAVEGRLVPTEAELARAEGRSYEPASALLERILAERRARWPKGKKYQPPAEPKTDDLPALPEGWAWATVDQILSEPLANGRSVPSRTGGFPVLRLSALEIGTLDLRERKGGSWGLDAARPFLVALGDFLIARGNGSLERVGAGALVRTSPEPIAFPDTMIRLRFNGSASLAEYAVLAWRAPLLRRQIEESAKTTAGIYKVNQDAVGRYVLPLPPLAEQARIVAEVERRLSVIDTLEHTVEQTLARCARLRQSILKRAFEGKLVPQDPSDEPASELLARIRAQRTAEARA